MWITQLAPFMRTWLRYLYRDFRSIPASQFSVDPGHWEQLSQCIDDTLTFTSHPSGTAIPIGGKLIQVRHQRVSSRSELMQVFLSDRRKWLRVRDPKSTKRKFPVIPIASCNYIRIGYNTAPLTSPCGQNHHGEVCV